MGQPSHGEWTLSNVAQVIQNLRRAEADTIDVLASAVQDEVDMIYRKSQRLVPLDTSALQGTGRTVGPEVTRRYIKFQIQYGGGPAAAYAIVQHENLEYKHTGIRSAKYLERPAMDAAGGMPVRVANRIQRTLGNTDYVR